MAPDRRLDPEALPRPADRPVAMRVRPAAEQPVREGHPWLFGDSVVSLSRPAAAGDVVVLFDRKNRFLGAGLYDPEGLIRVQLLVHREPAEIGPGLFRARIAEALGLRTEVASRQTTGYRVLSGGNDRMPGLVADAYGRTLVLKIFSEAWLPHLRSLVPAFLEVLAPERILLLASERVSASPRCPPEAAAGAVVHDGGTGGTGETGGTGGKGEPGGTGGTGGAGDPGGPGDPEDGVPFLETGLRFEAHPFQGHKTGFYLDQRDNRRMLGGLASGARVLNVFSYTGGFSVHAARGGAREVVSVDRAEPVLAQARRHFELNRGDPAVAECRHRTVEGDAFGVMAGMEGRGEPFDVVVIDPPSFARAARQRERAIRAYRSLTTLALPLLRRDGLLVQASCSSRVPTDEFYAAVHAAARASGRPLRELERTGHPPDHPVTFPEGEYLKCLWARG